jgi:hypothetical protein
MSANPEWLIMLYFSGDNDLSPEMVRAIDDIAEAGVPEGVVLTVQYDPSFKGLPPLRYFLRGPKAPVKLQGTPIPLPNFAEPAPPGAENAADPARLEIF